MLCSLLAKLMYLKIEVRPKFNMEYQLDPNYLRDKNKSKLMIIVLSLLVLFLISYIMGNQYWIAPIIILASFSVWLKVKYRKQENQVKQYKVVLENQSLTYHWPDGFSEIKKDQIKCMEIRSQNNVCIELIITKTDSQLIGLKGFDNMFDIAENIKKSLSPQEILLKNN